MFYFFKEAAFLMNLDIERTEKNFSKGQVKVIIGVFFFGGGLLHWVGLGWVWAMVAFYLSGSRHPWSSSLEIIVLHEREVCKCLHTLGTVYILWIRYSTVHR